MADACRRIAEQHPDKFRTAHNGQANGIDFVNHCAWVLKHEHDTRWGLNFKRDTDTLSQDVLTFRVGPTDRHVECIDFIAGAGGPNPQIVWNDITDHATMGQPGTARYAEPQQPGDVSPHSNLPKLSADQLQVVRRFAEHLGLPVSGGNEARDWLRRLAEQIQHDLPGSTFGVKSTTEGSTQSNNVLSCREGNRLLGWILLRESGPQQLNADVDAIDISPQAFIAVTAANHLPERSPSLDLSRAMEAVAALSTRCDQLVNDVRALKETLARL